MEYKIGQRVRYKNKNTDCPVGTEGKIIDVGLASVTAVFPPFDAEVFLKEWAHNYFEVLAEAPHSVLGVTIATHDPVNHPKHYTSHPSGIECIQITEHMSFNVGNAMEYLWRADEKGAPIQDLEKAKWYIEREIEKRRKEMPL